MAPGRPRSSETPDPGYVFGFPKFTLVFAQRFAPVLRALTVVHDALNSIVDRGYDTLDPWQWIVLNLGRLNGVAMGELITLAANGYGHGAMKILRSMLETTVDAEFLRLKPEQRKAYFDWDHHERWKVYQSLKRMDPRAYEQIGQDELDRAKAEYERVRLAFSQERRASLRGRKPGAGADAGADPKAYHSKRTTRRRWCELDLGTEARAVELGDLYDLLNPLTTRLLHGGVFSLVLHFDPRTDPHRIDVPPSMAWVQQALVGGHACLRHTIKTLSEALGVESTPSLAAVQEAEVQAWQGIARAESGPNQP